MVEHLVESARKLPLIAARWDETIKEAVAMMCQVSIPEGNVPGKNDPPPIASSNMQVRLRAASCVVVH